jgi:hypothetical protein
LVFCISMPRNQPFVRLLPTFIILLLRNPGRSKGLEKPLLAFSTMLRIVFLAFLSSVITPFASESPLQGDGLHQMPGLLHEGRHWNPVSALTSMSYKKGEEECKDPYGPLPALTSAFRQRDDSYGPPLGFTSTQYNLMNGLNKRGHFIEAPSIITMTLVTTTGAPTTQSSTPTSESKP